MLFTGKSEGEMLTQKHLGGIHVVHTIANGSVHRQVIDCGTLRLETCSG